MNSAKSRFSSLAQAVKERTVESTPSPLDNKQSRLDGAGVHKPVTALGAVGEALRERVGRLETELAETSTANAGLVAELQRVKALSERVGDTAEEFRFLDVDTIVDRLPKDRLRGGCQGPEFEELLADIEANGQNDAITVRRSLEGTFEIAAGRRRLEACRLLKRSVLARVRDLNDQSMLGVQFSENERRADISALERARWFAEVRERLQIPAKNIAAQFGVDPSTFSLYLRLARFPGEILERLQEPRRLAVLPARRVMEAIESDSTALQRILGALDTYQQTVSRAETESDPAAQIDVLLQAADSRGGGREGSRSPVPERRSIVHQGRRIGTLTRNGGQWVFRFATSIPDSEVLLLAERLALPVSDPDGD
ncbi:ParB/RepB/Spo0J family partition protein [Beijerinckia indica]|uniref:ParB-like partition protein n=1 Tax=Beijerinckia indica subsp. indica (strain ATCC 9039 / DSM 1715 / NCIMB 8712) TaxID=395963 RepID=B2ILL6_BEII9|nr:ParB/RepB/Spo0J family partition protein [Beijerinckia indica]ACB97416.1 parB-like partition protein [Beijerinckia indica subsp. indica ATCC 9039]